MPKLRAAVLAFIVAIVAIWIWGWGKNDGHLFGDVLLAREMVWAGHNFVQGGPPTYGLPVYRTDAAPYTHLTPGPDWIQALFAVPDGALPRYRWHWIATAALSFAALFWIRRSVAGITVAAGESDLAQERAWAGTLFVAATPAFILFTAHPYCAGTLLGNAITVAAAAWWAGDGRRWGGALLRMALALFAAFWLGLMPVASGTIWMLTSILRFGDRQRRRARVLTFLGVAVIVAVVAVALKVAQSVALLGSLRAATADFEKILTFRTTGLHHDARALFWLPYFFGLALPLVPLLLARNSRARAHWPLMLGFVAGGLAWQIVMPGHAAAHAYLIRELMVPVALLLALGATTARAVRIVLWTALAEAACVVAVLVGPLVVAGQPLWQLILRRL